MAALPGFLGDTAFNVGKMKVPYGAIAAVAGVAGIWLVLRARSSGSSVVSVGTPAQSAAGASFGSSFAPDPSASLANLSQQVSDVEGQIAALPGSATAASGTALQIDPHTGALLTTQGWWNPRNNEIWSNAKGWQKAPAGAPLTVGG